MDLGYNEIAKVMSSLTGKKMEIVVDRMPIGIYRQDFLGKRRIIIANQKNESLQILEAKLLIEMAKVLDKKTVSSLIKQINRDTCVSRDALLDIMRDEVETKIGINPVLYAPNIESFSETKSYLNGLLKKLSGEK